MRTRIAGRVQQRPLRLDEDKPAVFPLEEPYDDFVTFVSRLDASLGKDLWRVAPSNQDPKKECAP